MFKKNVGSLDRIIRAVVGIALIAAFFMNPHTTLIWVGLVVGLVLLFTSAMSSCAIYSMLGLRTNKGN